MNGRRGNIGLLKTVVLFVVKLLGLGPPTLFVSSWFSESAVRRWKVLSVDSPEQGSQFGTTYSLVVLVHERVDMHVG